MVVLKRGGLELDHLQALTFARVTPKAALLKH